jgi:hypothetical protein
MLENYLCSVDRTMEGLLRILEEERELKDAKAQVRGVEILL